MHADIRPARVSDIDALISIENAVFETDRLSRRSFRRHISSGGTALLVAESGSALAGYALLFYRKNSPAARLYSIAVAGAFASAGIGRSLLSAVEDTAFAKGCSSLRLEVREQNRRAIEFYKKAGYQPIGRKDNYYQDGAAALRFEKALRERNER